MRTPENYTSENLRELRNTSGMSRRELLEKLQEHGVEMHANSLRRIEDGEQPMKIHEAQAFAAIFNIGLEQFIIQPINSEVAKVREALARVLTNRMRIAHLLDSHLSLREKLRGQIEAGEFLPPEQLEASKQLADALALDTSVVGEVEALAKHFGGTGGTR